MIDSAEQDAISSVELEPEHTEADDTSNSSEPIANMATPTVLGCVASPARYESTTKHYYFWVQPNTLVEATQLVHTASCVSGRDIEFFGVVEEVSRSSGRRSFGEERDTKDGDPFYEPPFKPEGTTYCEVTILRTEPPFMTPPIEESRVYLGDENAAAQAYDYASLVDSEHDANWGLVLQL